VGFNARVMEQMLILAGTDSVQLLYRNAQQVKKIVQAKYTTLRFDNTRLSPEEMGFGCSLPVRLSLFDI
jgi:ethanolaminephosphotransferase